jgi:hypothetical protein
MSSSSRWLFVLAMLCAGCDTTVVVVGPTAVTTPQATATDPVTVDLCAKIRSGEIKPIVRVPACDAKEQ